MALLGAQTASSVLWAGMKTYCDLAASTEDFQRVVEKHYGQDMTWFFNQWIYGTDIPTYKFNYTRVKQPDGKWKVACQVGQSEVPDDFQMYVPLRIEFGDEKYARARVFIKGSLSEFDLPLPMEPKKIVFNDLESVLCEVK